MHPQIESAETSPTSTETSTIAPLPGDVFVTTDSRVPTSHSVSGHSAHHHAHFATASPRASIHSTGIEAKPLDHSAPLNRHDTYPGSIRLGTGTYRNRSRRMYPTTTNQSTFSTRTYNREVHLSQLRPRNFRWEFRPWIFLQLCFRGYCKASMALNLLWPFVPAGLILYFVRPDLHLWVFVINYIAMAPAANLLGYAGQELAQKLPHVLGTLVESTFGAIVEIVMFTVLLVKGRESSVQIIRHAILGSILANLLLCIGMCFFVGGVFRKEQLFHEAMSEAGSGLLLVAGMGLVMPAIFALATSSSATVEMLTPEDLADKVLRVSRATSIILVIAYAVWLFFQTHSHHNIFDDLLRDDDPRDPEFKAPYESHLTMTEAIVAIVFCTGVVSLIAISLAEQIHYLVVTRDLKDSFVGLILVPLVEKAAGHLSAMDEAWDDRMNMALSHILGSSTQTALLNAPFIVFLAWMMGVPLSLNFEPFEMAAMILTVLAIGSFLRNGKSNYLEGVLCVSVYILIAICAYEMPNPAYISNDTH